jgi:hypothetical protein
MDADCDCFAKDPCASGNPKIIKLFKMHLKLYLTFMPARGVAHYGPLSVGALFECFMDGLKYHDGCRLLLILRAPGD